METTNSNENPQRRVEDRKSAEVIDWAAPGAPAVPLSPAATSGDAPDLQQLKALALAATPGEWEMADEKASVYAADGSVYSIAACDFAEVGRNWSGTDYATPSRRRANAAYIAAANPAVVLNLIACIERAAAPAPTAPFAWMKSNEITGLLDAADKATHQGEPVRQYGRIYARQYDADMVPVYAASPATASGDELPPLSDAEYQSILGPVLSREGMRRYRNADPLNLDPSDLRAMIDRARAAVSAATKPTADLMRYDVVRLRDGLCEVPLPNTGTYVRFADVQSLLATKPAAAPEGFVLMPKRLTRAMQDVLGEEDWTWSDLLAAAETITEDEYNELIGNDMLTPGAAQTADQVRNQALEEAAKKAEEYSFGPCGEYDYSYDDASAKADERADTIANEIRALKSSATQTTEGAGNA